MNMNIQGHLVAALVLVSFAAYSQNRPVLTDEEKVIAAQIGQLRKLPDREWTQMVGQLARQIQQLPADAGKTALIGSLGNLATEGDAGHEALQVVAATLAQVLRDSPNPGMASTLAQLVRYEHLDVTSHDPSYRGALAKLEAEDRGREQLEFTLLDLKGHPWSMHDLRGKVVLVNFWATWCPPCRKEMPDMETLYRRFGPSGLVILAISDEDAGKVAPFLAAQNYTYPVLLDPGRKVHRMFSVDGIPKSFVYGRDGKLVTQAIDRRTEGQFLAMLKQAGLGTDH